MQFYDTSWDIIGYTNIKGRTMIFHHEKNLKCQRKINKPSHPQSKISSRSCKNAMHRYHTSNNKTQLWCGIFKGLQHCSLYFSHINGKWGRQSSLKSQRTPYLVQSSLIFPLSLSILSNCEVYYLFNKELWSTWAAHGNFLVALRHSILHYDKKTLWW